MQGRCRLSPFGRMVSEIQGEPTREVQSEDLLVHFLDLQAFALKATPPLEPLPGICCAMFAPLRMSGLIFRLARSGKPALRPATRAWHPGAAACGQVHLRSFCADGPGGLDMRDMRDSIKSVAAALSALRYGPPAVEKILSMLGSKAKSSTTWPAGKTVKIAFHEMDSGKDAKTFVWKPDKEYFHEVIMKAATGIGDFDVSYQDKDGDMLQLDATKPGIESFLADHCQHESPRLKADGPLRVGFVGFVCSFVLRKQPF
eukprot:Skav202255  [mRNA]  locus=scaffold1417:351329:353448:+ [translate_table: standard]